MLSYIKEEHPNILLELDRIGALTEHYTKDLKELDSNIPMMQQILNKPFEKEIELAGLKTDLSRLEREIGIKVQENQMKQNGQLTISADGVEETQTNNPTKVIKMKSDNQKEAEKKEQPLRKTKGMQL